MIIIFPFLYEVVGTKPAPRKPRTVVPVEIKEHPPLTSKSPNQQRSHSAPYTVSLFNNQRKGVVSQIKIQPGMTICNSLFPVRSYPFES